MMKGNLVVCLMLVALAACTAQKNKAKMYIVTGTVTQTAQYCGGANPGQEMLNELEKPRPLADKVLWVRSGTTNNLTKPVLKTKSDPYGNFTLILKAGKYCLIDEEKGKRFVSKGNDDVYEWDNTCLKKNWSSCDQILEVGKLSTSTVTVNYHKYCEHRLPCVKKFKGPLPQ